MKNLLITLGLITTAALIPSVAFADGNCQPSYGGYGSSNCGTGTLTVNKTVKDPTSGQFVDNLGFNDTQFTSGNDVYFQISVANTGSATINNVVVKDVFPPYLVFVSGNGTYDQQTNTDTITVGQLSAGASQTFNIHEQVINNAVNGCIVNKAIAYGDNQTQKEDTAQLCIQNNPNTTKGGLSIFPPKPGTKTPATGPEVLSLFALIPAAFAGLKLRKTAGK